MEIPGYNETDCERQKTDLGRSATVTASDMRNPFQHDVDRILYAPEFHILQGKTQVVASDQMGPFHNRLTHSLRVAQLGRRITVLLATRAAVNYGLPTPSPDLVEAACLLHDVGHPPFGHIGEEEINKTLDTLNRENSVGKDNYADGFQANAQNLRVVTRLAVRSQLDRGLTLTRAVLDASIKYPWARNQQGYGAAHWGCYVSGSENLSDAEALKWAIQKPAVPGSPISKDDLPARPVEEQIMDWCDEVTYACHDLEDFVRAGLIPLAEIFAGLPDDPDDHSSAVTTGEASRLIHGHVAGTQGQDAVAGFMDSLQGLKSVTLGAEKYRGDALSRARLREMTSKLLNFLLGTKEQVCLKPITNDVATLTRYNAFLMIDDDIRRACKTLTVMVRYYVIDAPSLATQQHGQRRLIREVIEWLSKDPSRLLRADRQEEYAAHNDNLRAAADAVWGMTETELRQLHRRLSGVDYGQLRD